jgi:Carboxypeptidase regulatory-like domain
VGAVLAAMAAAPAAGRNVRIVDRVEPVCGTPGQGPAVVLVHVMDHEGRPLPDIAVTVTPRRRAVALQGVTDTAGAARFSLPSGIEARITAHHVGFSTSVAERVKVRPGCLSAVTLPLQIEPPKEILTAAPSKR